MHWKRGAYEIELIDEPCYTFGSADNVHEYAHEILLVPDHPYSQYGVLCFRDGELVNSAVLGGFIGSTINEHSCVLLSDRVLIGIGDSVAVLRIPDLGVLWATHTDTRLELGTCFGLHLTPDEQAVIIHGEMEIRRYSLNGLKEWSFSGRDIFTGPCTLAGNTVVVIDFEETRYSIDLESGTGRITGTG